MKKLTFITASLFVLLAVTSCKKENTDAPAATPTPAPAPTYKKIAKVESVDHAKYITFTYGADGRLAMADNHFPAVGSFKHVYDFSNMPYAAKTYNAAGVAAYDYVNARATGTVISSIDFRSLTPNGDVLFTTNSKYFYNTAGYREREEVSGYTIALDYQNGDMVGRKVTDGSNGQVSNNITVEYYNEYESKMNLSFFDWFMGFNSNITDRESFGKLNKHLLKKVVSQTTGTRYEYVFTYSLDAAGYINDFTCTTTENANPPVSKTYRITYQ